MTFHPRSIALVAACLLVGVGALRAQPAPPDVREYDRVPRANAQAALRRLRVGDVLHVYCPLCGDDRSRRMTVRSLRLARSRDTRPIDGDVAPAGAWTVEVNGRPIDLAYTYVRIDRRWRNLGLTVGLAADDVPVELIARTTGMRWRCGDARDATDALDWTAPRDPCATSTPSGPRMPGVRGAWRR